MLQIFHKKLNKKGFTLAELLIVVAIVAILAAIAIPVFTSSLDRAKEATDAANLRAAQGAAAAAYLNVQYGTADGSVTDPTGKYFTTDGTFVAAGGDKIYDGQSTEHTGEVIVGKPGGTADWVTKP